ncbi:hypothetical protein ACOJVU_06335 [Mycobacterium sp. THU-M104]|uniref:hypothetical protein n=1 Tax=Mycobacterium sp. THU-M104 TaxID=3410515 RepID=UPI003B9934D0
MTTPSSRWGDERQHLSHQLQMSHRALGRVRSRRLCQQFASVGVRTAPGRLRAMAAGVPAAADEVTDVHFALIALEMNRTTRTARIKRLKRRGTRSLLLGGLILVVLHFLLCVAYLMLNLAQQSPAL